MKQKQIVTVEEVHQIVPEADVVKLSTANTYLIIVNKPKIYLAGSSNSPLKEAEKLMQLLNDRGIKALYIALDEKDEIKILEMKSRLTSEA
jgi:hypothetical protein